ncbi:hypothetical protein [Moritella sp. F3]|uniref:hypothetical protein n=1 Tax=Moritella sp. F3 TaxID=2718882 RepID=UPI0018E1A190|nr:hypothetical protein [Moritella sp. F3]GIC75365.1 hypothetical protein FMO001_00920 [Moritella sp. F1]GIC80510.1 hypothetical protein FMO003_07910 [Moritella sp. F3]
MTNKLTKEECNALLHEFNTFEIDDEIELPKEIVNILKSYNIHSVIMENGTVCNIED